MTATYFPYTFIAEAEALAWAGALGGLRLYLPSDLEIPPPVAALKKKGVLGLSTPLLEAVDKRVLRAVLAECRNWGGRDAQGAAALSGDIPFFEETASSRIRSAIRSQSRPGQPHDQESSPIPSLVLLHLAQALDMEHQEMARALEAIRSREQNLIAELADPREKSAGKLGAPLVPADDPKHRNLGSRLAAWSRLILADPAPLGVYATPLPEVVDILLDKTGCNPLSCRIDDIPWQSGEGRGGAWKEALSACLDSFCSGKADAAATIQAMGELPVPDASSAPRAVSLGFSLIEQNPRDLFASCAAGPRAKDAGGGKIRNTVICCLMDQAP